MLRSGERLTNTRDLPAGSTTSASVGPWLAIPPTKGPGARLVTRFRAVNSVMVEILAADAPVIQLQSKTVRVTPLERSLVGEAPSDSRAPSWAVVRTFIVGDCSCVQVSLLVNADGSDRKSRSTLRRYLRALSSLGLWARRSNSSSRRSASVRSASSLKRSSLERRRRRA